MEILAKYIFGSEDSVDVDMMYVVNKLPSIQEGREFINNEKITNGIDVNLITIEDGIVIDTQKGNYDTVNNCLLDTYYLHKQEYPLFISKRLDRNIPMKTVEVVRYILSLLSRTQYRKEIKNALRSNWKTKIDVLSMIDFSTIDFTTINKGKMTKEDAFKNIAFQIGQVIGLIDRYELYTKRDICDKYEYLTPYIYRQKDSDFNEFCAIVTNFAKELKDFCYEYEEYENMTVKFYNEYEETVIDIKNEKVISYEKK